MKQLAHALLLLLSLAGCSQPASPPADNGVGPATQPTAAVPGNDSPAPSSGPSAAPSEAQTSAPSEAPGRPVKEQSLAYGEIGNHNLDGFLAMPADAAEPLPGLLVIHGSSGLDDHIRAVTRRLAGEGYIVLAVDLYNGAAATTPEAAQTLVRKALAAPDDIRSNLSQAHEYLEKYAFSPTVGVIGLGFGGRLALQTALDTPKGLGAAVIYEGALIQDRKALETLKVPLLGFFGERDTVIPVADVLTFRSTLQSLGKDAQIRVYSRVGHKFTNPADRNYDAEAAADSWQRTLEFLDAHLRAGDGA